jgi:hypothetical protein
LDFNQAHHISIALLEILKDENFGFAVYGKHLCDVKVNDTNANRMEHEIAKEGTILDKRAADKKGIVDKFENFHIIQTEINVRKIADYEV